MENKDYHISFEYATSIGMSSEVADFFAKIFVRFAPLYREEFEDDPEEFAKDYKNKTVEELAYVQVFEKIKLFEEAKSWGHSNDWAFFYADDGEETKDGAYEHIRTIAQETIYDEAFNEYIARGFSEKYATLMATEMKNREWGNPVEVMESIFLDYERLFNLAKSKNKNDDFADFFAEFSCATQTLDYYDSYIADTQWDDYNWKIALFREKLKLANKSEEYLKNIRQKLVDDEIIYEEILDENSDDYSQITKVIGYADGIEYAMKNNIPEVYQFAELLSENYARYFFFRNIHPYKEIALLYTIEKYNQKALVKLPVSQSQLDLIIWLRKKINDQDEEDRKNAFGF